MVFPILMKQVSPPPAVAGSQVSPPSSFLPLPPTVCYLRSCSYSCGWVPTEKSDTLHMGSRTRSWNRKLLFRIKTKLSKQVTISSDVQLRSGYGAFSSRSVIFILPLQNIAMNVATEAGLCI